MRSQKKQDRGAEPAKNITKSQLAYRRVEKEARGEGFVNPNFKILQDRVNECRRKVENCAAPRLPVPSCISNRAPGHCLG